MKILGSVPLYLHVGKVRILYFRGKFKNWGLAEDFYVTALIVLHESTVSNDFYCTVVAVS
jgi:hypothetical protein